MQLACGLGINDLQQGNESFVYSAFNRFFGWEDKIPPSWPEGMEHVVADFLKLDHDGFTDRYPKDVFCYLAYRTGMYGGDDESADIGAYIIQMARENSANPLGNIAAAWMAQPPGIVQGLGMRMTMAREKFLHA